MDWFPQSKERKRCNKDFGNCSSECSLDSSPADVLQLGIGRVRKRCRHS